MSIIEEEYRAHTGRECELFHKNLVGLRPTPQQRGANKAGRSPRDPFGINMRRVRGIIDEKESKTAPKYCLSKAYMSDWAGDLIETDIDDGNVDKVGLAAWVFKFPNGWIADSTNSKAIGLRRIKLVRNPFYIAFKVRVKTSGTGTPTTTDHAFHISADTNLVDILDQIQRKVQGASNVEGFFDYTLESFTVTFRYLDKTTGEPHKTQALSFVRPAENLMHGWYNFLDLLNIPRNKVPFPDLTGTNNPDWYKNIYSFPNVWLRDNLYFHASFVTDDANKYLGQSGDVHDKITKLWQSDCSDREFKIWISFDGVNPVAINNYFSIQFQVELAFFANVANSYSL